MKKQACEICRRRFKNEASLEDHLRSEAHRLQVEAANKASLEDHLKHEAHRMQAEAAKIAKSKEQMVRYG